MYYYCYCGSGMSSGQAPLMATIPRAVLCPMVIHKRSEVMARKSSPLPFTDPAMLFHKHYAKLAVGIQSPNQLATILCSEGLVSHHTKRRVRSSSMRFVDKSSALLDAVEETLLASGDQKSTMLSLCAALEESGEPALRKIAAGMRACITG